MVESVGRPPAGRKRPSRPRPPPLFFLFSKARALPSTQLPNTPGGVASTDFFDTPTSAGDSCASPRTFALKLTRASPLPPSADGATTPPPPPATRVRVCYAAASLAGSDPRHPAAPASGPGPTKPNQDAWIAHERAGGGESLLLGVLDGHGVDGGRVSAAAAARLPRLAADAGLGRSDAGAAAGGLSKGDAAPGGAARWPGVRGPPSADTARRRRAGAEAAVAAPVPAWQGGAPGPPAAPALPSGSTEEEEDEDTSSGGGGSGTPLASGSAGSGGGISSSAGSGGPSLASAAAQAAGAAAGPTHTHHHHSHHSHHPTAVSSRPARAAGGVLALDAALARAHACVLSAPGIDCSLSGSTAALAAIDADGLSLAHVGDSRILLGRLDPASPGDLLPTLALTEDHTPGRPDEARRILAHRGRIGSYTHGGQPVGPLRVWLPHADAPGLCMTRALGDTVAAAAGVTARAETGARALEAGDRYLVLLSDGVHEFWANDDIMAAVHAVACAGGSPADAAAALVRVARGQWEAAEAGAADDCTAVVAFLDVA